ncbi:aldehyde dehydrogenase [gamma proteobacterium HTCC5015]|nr:aldehyde dehydrogenase [gamma proteobacterium HTCC5015]
MGHTVGHNPATGEQIGKVANTDLEQFPNMLNKARQAQSYWARLSYKERAVYIGRMRRYIMAHADELAKVVSESNGKTRVDALATEVLPITLACGWYAKNSQKVLRRRWRPTGSILFFNKLTTIEHLPVGVVGIISPWNYPLSIPFGEVIMGLMAGNAVVLKVAAATPLVGEAIQRIVEAGQLPEGLFQMVYGSGGEVSSAMLEHGIDKLFFTGSVPAGKSIMAAAAKTLTPLSLELGGNDPMIVLKDANLERAVNGAIWGGFQNAGQSCGGVERIYVHTSIYSQFVEALCNKTKALRHGVPSAEFNVDIGSLTTANQLKLVQSHIDEAVKGGAKVAAQSRPVNVSDKGFFHPATVLLDVTHDMTVQREESFGPVITVMPFNTEEEVIKWANDSDLALTSSVWTKDNQRGRAIAARLESGVTTVNDHLYTHGLSETPWGGWKGSGIGRTHGPEGLEEMTHAKVVNWDWMGGNRSLWWHPHDEATYNTLKAAMHMAFPSSVGEFVKSSAKVAPRLIQRAVGRWKV